MKVCFSIPFLCAASVTGTSDRIRSRRLEIDPKFISSENSEIWSNAKALMVSQRSSTSTDAGSERESSESAPCSSPSADWLRGQISEFSEEDLSNFFYWHVYTLPFAYKLFVEPEQKDLPWSKDRPWTSDSSPEYCGINGEYTKEIRSIHQQAQDFWSGSGVDDDIRVLCAHGSDLADFHNKLIPTLNVMFSGSYDEHYTVYDHATDVQDLISRLPGGYNFPLLTFNAFATDEAEEHDYPSIIIGDGYFEFQRSVGLGLEGPEYALTHEHEHHLQFSLNAQASESSHNTTRQELMADAFSAYFLAHKSGGDMTAEQLSNIHSVAYSVGDCEIDNSEKHHGTPKQRKCATRWGTSVAGSREAANIDLIDLKSRFDTWYDESLDIPDDFREYVDSSASFTRHSSYMVLQLLVILYGSTCVFGF